MVEGLALGRRCSYTFNMTKRRKQQIEAESRARYEANWPLNLACQISIAFKLKAVHDKGGHWIHTPVASKAGL